MSGKRLNEVINKSKRRAKKVNENKSGKFFNDNYVPSVGIYQQWDNITSNNIKNYKKLNKYGKIRSVADETTDKVITVRNFKEYLESAKKSYDLKRLRPSCSALKTDFEFIKTLGVGAFGRVMLVRYSQDKQYYAAKLMLKSALVKDKNVTHARNEKQILQAIRFPFTIHLEYFFQDNAYIYYILPLISGGELFAHLTRVSRFREDVSRFYCAQICLAFEYLHYIGLIFRDLKPENVLVDNQGFLKLADFGFCKLIHERTYTFCGTAEYLAPEMIQSKGYGRSVDWWTFGIFTYELCAGYTPFYSKSASKTYENISKCKYKVPFFFSNDLRDLIKNILQVDLSKRYGNLKNGVDDIKGHKWFSEVPWIMLLNRKIKPPFTPVVTRPDDTRNFEAQIEEPIGECPVDLYQAEFANF